MKPSAAKQIDETDVHAVDVVRDEHDQHERQHVAFHFRDGGRERVAAGQRGRGRVQRCLRSGGGGRGGSPRRRMGGGRCSMSSYDMVRLSANEGVAGLPGNFLDIGEYLEIDWLFNHV
ncbi:hypothetical protein [Burkholderia pyrrocinia]|uniref:hypothetical protein n=1 Tax=Burkholderia pyrrocinia TaxID=60550 RepID=UPI0030D140DB